jgi:hypothetical protein
MAGPTTSSDLGGSDIADPGLICDDLERTGTYGIWHDVNLDSENMLGLQSAGPNWPHAEDRQVAPTSPKPAFYRMRCQQATAPNKNLHGLVGRTVAICALIGGPIGESRPVQQGKLAIGLSG